MVLLSHPYMTTGKMIALTIWTFVSKVMSVFFKTINLQNRIVTNTENMRIVKKGKGGRDKLGDWD